MISKEVLALERDVIAWRRHMHQYPELSFQEVSSTAYLTEELKKIPGLTQCCSDLEVASNGYLQIFYISVRISSTQKSLFTKKIFLYIIKMKIDLFFGCFNTSEQV